MPRVGPIGYVDAIAIALSVNGTTLFCETVGDGAPCLVLHGGPGTDSAGLRRTLAPLAGALGLRLVFWDHRSSRRSARSARRPSTSRSSAGRATS